jgi:hypothetical protein
MPRFEASWIMRDDAGDAQPAGARSQATRSTLGTPAGAVVCLLGRWARGQLATGGRAGARAGRQARPGDRKLACLPGRHQADAPPAKPPGPWGHGACGGKGGAVRRRSLTSSCGGPTGRANRTRPAQCQRAAAPVHPSWAMGTPGASGRCAGGEEHYIQTLPKQTTPAARRRRWRVRSSGRCASGPMSG